MTPLGLGLLSEIDPHLLYFPDDLVAISTNKRLNAAVKTGACGCAEAHAGTLDDLEADFSKLVNQASSLSVPRRLCFIMTNAVAIATAFLQASFGSLLTLTRIQSGQVSMCSK